jgi:hypothetical protein
VLSIRQRLFLAGLGGVLLLCGYYFYDEQKHAMQRAEFWGKAHAEQLMYEMLTRAIPDIPQYFSVRGFHTSDSNRYLRTTSKTYEVIVYTQRDQPPDIPRVDQQVFRYEIRLRNWDACWIYEVLLDPKTNRHKLRRTDRRTLDIQEVSLDAFRLGFGFDAALRYEAASKGSPLHNSQNQ